QAEMQPKLILVGPEERLGRRSGALVEPAKDRPVQGVDFRLGDRAQAAIEPRSGQSETRRLQAAQLRTVQIPPTIPKIIIRRVSIKEPGELVDVRCVYIAAKQMTKQVQRRITQGIDRVKRVIRPSIEILLYPARPELFDTRRREPFGVLIPQAKVHLD